LFCNGAETSWVKKNAIPMKTLNDAIEMRNTIKKFRESCDLQRHSRASLLTIVGWWRTNRVEVSGMYAEMRKSIFQKNPELGTSASNIYLVDGEMLC
jgi:NADH dehydrogenase